MNYLREIERKNEIFEQNNLTTTIIQNRINKLLVKNKKNISFNELNNKNISEKRYSTKELGEYADYLNTFPIKENNISNYCFCENPKISIIIPTHNYKKFIYILHKSIQEQSFTDIEIIYIDDFSTDNSTQLIENLQKKDKRIIILKNKENKGPFYSRNKGAIFARGEYIQFLDGDDLLVGDILQKAYITAKTKNIDVVQYFFIQKHGKDNFKISEITKKGIIYQPELGDQMFYGKGYLEQTNYYVLNKIIKTEIFLKALLLIGDDVLKIKLFFNEDLLQLFCLLRVSNSFLFIEHTGYIHFNREENKLSLVKNSHNPGFANLIFHDNFVELRALYKITKNNKHDKALCLEFLKMNNMIYWPITSKITKGYELFDEVFDLLMNSEYFNDNQKHKFKELRKKMMKNRK